MQELEIEFKKDEKAFKDKLQKEQLSVVGIVLDLRKIITKTGKNMMFLYCEGFDYDFEVTIFDRDYADYKDTLEVGKMVIVEGNLDVNFEYGRKNIRSKSIIIASLTQVRDQAKEMWLLDNVKRKMLWAQELWEENTEFDSHLEEKISENKTEKPEKNIQYLTQKYVVEIPAGTKLEQIHKLKDFLGSQAPWVLAIYILLSGKEIDTKFTIESLQDLHIWETQNL